MKRLILMPAATVLCCVFSCSRSNNKPNNNTSTYTPTDTPTFSVTAISPLHAPGGQNITISGKGFSTNTASDAVKVNGRSATIISANDSALVVTIPSLCGTGTVTVTIGGKTVNGPSFSYDSVYLVSTYAGSRDSVGNLDGTGINARFGYPSGICSDLNGNLYVADRDNFNIRKVAPGGVVTTLTHGGFGYKDGQADTAKFNFPIGICPDAQGSLYITEQMNYAVRQLNTSGFVSTIAGGTMGYADGTGTSAKFSYLSGICNAGGIFYISDFGNHVIRSVTPGGVTGTFLGSPGVKGSQDGTGSSALLSYPFDICIHKSGNLFATDGEAHKVLKITPGAVMTTFAGNGTAGSADGIGTSATFNYPTGICADTVGNLYVSDEGSRLVRKINPSGVVTTIAGNSKTVVIDGIGTAASFAGPNFICTDPQGNLYVTDVYCIRKITIQ